MFECKLCGLLSLGGDACPACGSQIRIDLSLDDQDSSPLPNEIPGLDEAAESWYQLDGNEQIRPIHGQDNVAENTNQGNDSGGLPFGLSGNSNINSPNLPFGIGSNSQGIPFDDAGDEKLPSVIAEPVVSNPSITTVISTPPVENQVEQPIVVVPEKINTQTNTNPLFESTIEPQETEMSIPLQEEVIDTPQILEANPDSEMWTINAASPDMDAIYSSDEQVVEYVHESDEPIIYVTDSQAHFNPGADDISHNSQQQFHSPLESSFQDDQSQLILKLHPAKALGIDLSLHPELEDLLAEAFYSIASEDWTQAAKLFQNLITSKPDDTNLFNNYGLSLLQRALEMNKSQNLDIVSQSETQFRSAILALREAAKSQPNNSTILLNLSHALLASGRTDKALQIIRVHNSTNNSIEGRNLEAAALAALGQGESSKQILLTVHNEQKQSSKPHLIDQIITSNLEKFM